MLSRTLDSGDPALPLHAVANDRLRLVFLPTIGGRLISLRVDGRELLWHNPALLDDELRAVVPMSSWPVVDGTLASWANVGGSKSWPAPQGWNGPDQWQGPPDAVLDSGEYAWRESPTDDGLLLSLTSADDPRTGLRIERRFEIPHAGAEFVETLALTNASDRPVRWAPWEVCQVDIDAGARAQDAAVVVAVKGRLEPIDLGDHHGTLATRRVDGHVEVPVQDVIGKRGFADATGSIAWRGPDGEGLELRFEPVAHAEYPDHGSRAEVWMQTPLPGPLPSLSSMRVDARLAELEVLGPLVTLEPGGSTELDIRWIARSTTRSATR
ncbi:hypothetical protein J7E29_00845 [Streptomyces sp. ISL-90]|nr:hypothetical protein [Streptomyces sp. ISL-90]